jgi:hypothetical protein
MKFKLDEGGFSASRLLDNGTVEQHFFSSQAQARQFVEKHSGKVLAVPALPPERGKNRIRKKGQYKPDPSASFKFPVVKS